jgi:predicted O-methyltransferase YrrM
MKDYAVENKIPIIMDEGACLLEIILKAVKPKKILEIGTAIGYSSIIMSGTLNEDGRIDTIEVNPDMVEKAWENISDAGLQGMIRIIEGDAGEILPLLHDEYDVVFLDAAKSRYIEFLPHCIRLVRKSGLIITDNVLYKGMTKGSELVKHKQRTAVKHLREYLEELEQNEQLKTSLIPIGDGITISVKVG